MHISATQRETLAVSGQRASCRSQLDGDSCDANSTWFRGLTATTPRSTRSPPPRSSSCAAGHGKSLCCRIRPRASPGPEYETRSSRAVATAIRRDHQTPGPGICRQRRQRAQRSLRVACDFGASVNQLLFTTPIPWDPGSSLLRTSTARKLKPWPWRQKCEKTLAHSARTQHASCDGPSRPAPRVVAAMRGLSSTPPERGPAATAARSLDETYGY